MGRQGAKGRLEGREVERPHGAVPETRPHRRGGGRQADRELEAGGAPLRNTIRESVRRREEGPKRQPRGRTLQAL